MARSDVHIITTRGWNPERAAYIIECTCGDRMAHNTIGYAEQAYTRHILDAIRANRAGDKAV